MQAGHWGGRECHGWEPVSAYCQEEGDKGTKEVHQRELLLATPQQLVAAPIQEGRLMANRSITRQSVQPTLHAALELVGWMLVSQAHVLRGSSAAHVSHLQESHTSPRNEHRLILFSSASP